MSPTEDQGVSFIPGAELDHLDRFDGVSPSSLNPGKERGSSNGMSEAAWEPSADRKAPRLPALAGLRVIVALHIYLFHIMQAHQAGLLTFGVLDALPAQLGLLLRRGFVSTGLFFQLSGLLLAYAYLDAKGRPRIPDRAFWWGRFLRLYPLYFLSLLLLVPVPALLPITSKPTAPGSMLGMVVTNLTLTQAWFPPYAIAWNAPAWALSAFALFYAVFPIAARCIAGWDRTRLQALLIALVLVSWSPMIAFLIADPERNAWTATSVTVGGYWLSILRFDPLVWLPQFLSGLVLGRLIRLQIDAGAPTFPHASRREVSVGDVAVAAVVLLLSCWSDFPYVLLRHGLMVPMTLLILADLARGRGLIARALAWHRLGRLSEASFGLFALQMPIGVWFAFLTLRSAEGTTANLVGLIATTLAIAILWTEAVQRPLLRRLRGSRPTPREATGERGQAGPAATRLV
jgi:peptidoglycan/LPS O-acetylase OafA/YrhL